MSERNPNVFYELGIAHTIGKDAVIISQKEQDIPFDIKHLPFIIYEANEEGLEKLRRELGKVAIPIAPKVNYVPYRSAGMRTEQ